MRVSNPEPKYNAASTAVQLRRAMAWSIVSSALVAVFLPRSRSTPILQPRTREPQAPPPTGTAADAVVRFQHPRILDLGAAHVILGLHGLLTPNTPPDRAHGHAVLHALHRRELVARQLRRRVGGHGPTHAGHAHGSRTHRRESAHRQRILGGMLREPYTGF